MSDQAIQLEDVSKFYRLYDSPKDRLKEALHPFGRKRHREFFALKNINLTVPKGEVLGIVGRNGSGKSTLLKIVSGIIPANSGAVLVNGRVSAMVDLGAGMNPDFDGIQNIFFGGIMLGFSREEMKNRLDDIVSFADIGNFINQPMRTYSSGMKARLGFALAVSIDPEILVVDEVLAVGDDLFRRKCYSRMEAMLKTGCTILFVSHSVGSINEFCTRAILLDCGDLLLDGPSTMVTRYYHKLLYSSSKNAAAVRLEILEQNKDGETKRLFAEGRLRSGQEQSEYSAKGDLLTQSPYWVAGLNPTTTTHHQLEDVEITNAHIESETGESVNVLVMYESYTLVFNVHFRQTIHSAKFASLIQNSTGISIAGFACPSKKSDRVAMVAKGDVYSIRHSFRCALLPGTYFVSLAVSSLTEDGQVLPVCRINDVLAFKVQDDVDLSRWGLVGLDQTGTIKRIETTDDQ